MHQETGKLETIVIGCGVSGLTCGIRLLEKTFDVTIVARELPPHTTSDAAAAIWYPYRASPIERILGWGHTTLDEFYRLMPDPLSGVHAIMMIELFDHPKPDPWWKEVVHRFERVSIESLPPGYQDG